MNWGTISSKIAMVKGALVKLAAALGGVSLPAIAIIAVITAVALAFTNLWKNNEEFRNKITAIWDGIKAVSYTHLRKGGIAILREGYTMKRFTPAHIAPKRPLSIDDLKKRGFGEALYTNLTPAQRQGVIMLGDLDLSLIHI